MLTIVMDSDQCAMLEYEDHLIFILTHITVLHQSVGNHVGWQKV